MRKADLRGVGILVTRPAAQSDGLCRLIEQAGGRAIRFPLLEIADPTDTRPLQEIVARLHQFDLAIFISPNAVNRGLDRIEAAPGGLPADLKLAVVGRGSAREIERRLGRPADICPTERFDSEGLLARPELQQMQGKRVVIFRGDGGRELLAETLRQRGARVEYAEVYRRTVPRADAGGLLRRWRAGEIDILTVTSSEGLQNLLAMTGPQGRPLVLATPLVVVSQRAARRAEELGFEKRVLVAPHASDEALVETVAQWAAHAPANP